MLDQIQKALAEVALVTAQRDEEAQTKVRELVLEEKRELVRKAKVEADTAELIQKHTLACIKADPTSPLPTN
jgi:hypothetical protein